MIANNQLFQLNNAEIREYKSSIAHLPPKEFTPDISQFGRIRLWFRSIRGYMLWCCFVEGICVAYVALKYNYFYRYSFMNRDDMIINPYWTARDYRRKGLARYLLSYVIEKKRPNHPWKNLYAVVADNNTASIECLKSIGFRMIGYAQKDLWSYKIVEKNSMGLMVFRYAKGGHDEYST